MQKIIIIAFMLWFSLLTKAAFPSDFWPQAGQIAEWTVSSDNELCFSGSQPSFGPAIVATTFGGLVSNDYTGFSIKFDAFVSWNSGENTTVVLSSNGTWGASGKGVLIEINKDLIQGVSNFIYPGTMLTTDIAMYQNIIIKPGTYNSFIIVVDPNGIITVTVNGYTCPTSYSAPISILTAPTPVPRFTYFCTAFNGFKLRNLQVIKGSETRQYFLPFTPLSGTYYIDAINGNNIASGLSANDAWKTFENVNRTTLMPGTKILLKKGCVWNNRLEIRGYGTANNWISVGAYGTDLSKPKISLTNNANDIGLLICDLDKTTGTARQQNISYIEIKDIEIANTRLGIYYRSITGTSNVGFRVDNVFFRNINCDAVMSAINNATDKNAEITAQLSAVKGNLETLNGAADGGVREYIFPTAIFIGGQTATNQRVSIPSSQRTVLTELEITNCQMTDVVAGVMSWFYWPFTSGSGADAWRQIVNKVKLQNISATGIVNGIIGFDGVNGGCVTNASGEPQPDASGWGSVKNVAVTMGSAVVGRTWPNGTTGAIFNNSQRFLVDSCEFSEVINQGNPDGCGFDFESNNDLITIQHTKFLNNDGHSILLMNGGSYGGNTNIIIQKNLFARNIKSGTSQYELYLNATNDNGGVHSNLKLRNNIVFMRKKNINNASIGFYNTTDRSYVTATDNDRYYLEPTAAAVTISFLGLPYTYNATKNAVAVPVLNSISVNEGATSTTNPIVNIKSVVTKANAAYYMVSEKSTFTGATWILYNSDINFTLSPALGTKTIYFKVKNISGTSITKTTTIQHNAALKVSEITTDNVEISFRNQTLMQLYPNPVINTLFVTFKDDLSDKLILNNENYQVTLMMLSGAILSTSYHNGKSFNLDFSTYPTGTYIIKVKGSKNSFTRTVIKH